MLLSFRYSIGRSILSQKHFLNISMVKNSGHKKSTTHHSILTQQPSRSKSSSTSRSSPKIYRHESTNNSYNKMKIYPIKALQDNYMYLLVDEPTKQAAAVDPVNASAMASAVADHNVDLKCILTTHHHHDHAHGNDEMIQMFPELTVYGGDQRIQALTKSVSHGEVIKLGSLTIECLSTPCHTRGHICYYVHNEEIPLGGSQSFVTLKPSDSTMPTSVKVTNKDAVAMNTSELDPSEQLQASSIPVERVVFTGDTLFIGGCGRFFEGTSEQMDHSLNVVLGGLPADTKVYCGHEYTVNNLKFALAVEPQNADIKLKLNWAQGKIAKHEPTVPSTIGEERRINPFMRLNKPEVKQFTGEQNEIEVMSELRQRKNEFVA